MSAISKPNSNEGEDKRNQQVYYGEREKREEKFEDEEEEDI